MLTTGPRGGGRRLADCAVSRAAGSHGASWWGAVPARPSEAAASREKGAGQERARERSRLGGGAKAAGGPKRIWSGGDRRLGDKGGSFWPPLSRLLALWCIQFYVWPSRLTQLCTMYIPPIWHPGGQAPRNGSPLGHFAAEAKERLRNFITHVFLTHLDGAGGSEVIGFGVHLADSGRSLRQWRLG